MKTLINLAADRAPFICQSQSLNLFVAEPSYSKISSMHFYAWKKGLKTGCYYLRTKAPVTAQKFTVDPRLMAAIQNNQSHTVTQESDDTKAFYDTDSDSEDEMTPAQKKKALLDRLAAEYEDEITKLAEARDRGEEVCEMCSS